MRQEIFPGCACEGPSLKSLLKFLYVETLQGATAPEIAEKIHMVALAALKPVKDLERLSILATRHPPQGSGGPHCPAQADGQQVGSHYPQTRQVGGLGPG
jgi:hypothetical protein